jgi:hypothetical protein
MNRFARLSIIFLSIVSLAGCGNANKIVSIVGSVSPPLHDCAAFVEAPHQAFDRREVKGKFMLRYLVGSKDEWIDVEIRCGDQSAFKQRFTPVIDKIDVGDL